MKNNSKPPVITGYGSITALGGSSDIASNNMARGLVNNVLRQERFFPPGFVAPCFQVDSLAAGITRHGIDSLIGPEQAVNRTIKLALVAIFEGLENGGLSLKDLQSKRVGIALGTTVGCTFHNEEYYTQWRDGETPEPQPLYTYLSSNLAERVQAILGVSGPSLVITNACASGTDAIGIAKTWLQYDKCDIAIAGGTDELSRVACHGFKSLMLYSEKSCTPFDVNREGLNLGEGAGVLIMEREEDNEKAGRPFWGQVCGYGIGGDAHHPTAPHPEGHGLQRAVRDALKESGYSTGDIALINAHGTGTPANDRAETHAISALGFERDKTAVVSTKGYTGHTLGAAGGVEAVYALMALNAGEVSGSGGCNEVDPALEFPVLRMSDKRELSSNIGMSLSLAFGGSNSALVLEGVKR